MIFEKDCSDKEKRYVERVAKLTDLLFEPKSSVNFDFLFDCFNSIIYELNGKSASKSKNISNVLTRLKETSDFITRSRINMGDFITLKVLGKGAFGEVALVRHKDSDKVFALKSMNKTEMVKRDEALCLWEEREIMALSNSDWLVRMYYSFQDPVNIYMVMEFVQGGDMVNFMSSYDVDEDMAKFYLAEVSLGLDYLHSIGFIHRDIKPDNMLIDIRGHLKLCDFGTCIRMDKDGRVCCSIAVGTPDYISPEVLNSQSNNTQYGKEVDWWSVGIFLYEFLVGDTPFYSKSLIGTYNKILNFKKNLNFPEDVEISQMAILMIKGFLTDAQNRFGMKGIDEIASQPFFKDVKWTWDNIRSFTAPVIPDLSGETDASCFENNQEGNDLILPLPESSQLACDHFPFVGFSFSGENVFKNLKTKELVLNSEKNDKFSSQKDTKHNELKILIVEKENLNKKLIKNIELKDIELKKYESKFENIDKSRKKLEIESNELQKRIIELETEVQGYSQEIKKMEVFVKFSKIAETEAKKRYEELLDQSEPLKESNEHLKNAKRDLEDRLSSTENNLFSLKSLLEETERNLKSVKTLFHNLRDEVEGIKLTFKCETLEQLRSFVEKIQNSNIEMSSKLEGMEMKVKNFEETLKKDCSNEGSQIQSSLEFKTICDEKKTLQRAFDSLNVEYREIFIKNTQLNQALRSSNEENINLSEKINELSSKVINYSQNEIKHIKEKNDLMLIKGELETRLEKSMNLLRSFEIKINAFDEQFSYFELKMAVQIKQIEVLESTIKSRESLLSNLNEKINQLTEEKKESNIIIEMKNKEIEFLQTKVMKLEAEISVLNADFNELPRKSSSIRSNTSNNSDSPSLENSTELEKIRKELNDLKRTTAEAQKKYDKTLETERLLKEESIKKLNQVLSMPGLNKMGTVKAKSNVNQRSDRKVDQLYKQLQMDYFKLRDESAQSTKNYDNKITELNTIIMDLQATIDSMKKEKNIDVETSPDQLKYCVNDPRDFSSFAANQIIKQSFLFYPSKSGKSSRKINWTKCVVTLTNTTFTIYKDVDINDNNIMNKIDIALLYYVRPICQNDLIRSSPSDIPKIFQVIYNDDTDASEAFINEISNDKCTIIGNHCLINIQYHMPATCDVCGKGLWGFIKSSYAMECKNCHFKCHREHSQDPKSIPLCRDYENRRMAKEILLMSCSSQEQKSWIDLLLGLMKMVTPKNKNYSKRATEINTGSSPTLLEIPVVK